MTGKPGRPTTGVTITTRIEPETLAAIDAIAEQEQSSRAETIRALLAQALAREAGLHLPGPSSSFGAET